MRGAAARLGLIGIVAAVLGASPAGVALAGPEELGTYTVEGRSERAGAYAGTARIEAEGDALFLTVGREHAGAGRGELRRVEGGLAVEAVWRRDGASGALERLAGAERSAPVVLQARYRPTERGLLGRWRLRQGGRTLDQGRELLARTSAPVRAVRLTVSVDWEGRDLTPENLGAMQRLREALPDVPLTHFLNAAYFTKEEADAAQIAERTRSVLRPGDELGLHIHGWRSLFEAAGVAFRTGPNFWGEGHALHPAGCDEGHEVEIGAYTVMELRAVVSLSRELLGEAGFPIGRSFRAGGWMATPNVLEAIRAEGFTVDSSAVSADWHDELAGYRLRRRIREVWPAVTPLTGPFWIPTPAGPILEMPDTGALADYVTAAEMIAHVRAALRRFAFDPRRDIFVHVGFHQETAARYVDRVIEAIQALRAEPNPHLVIETLDAAAKRAEAQLAAERG